MLHVVPHVHADSEALVDEEDVALAQSLGHDSGLVDRLSESGEPKESVDGGSVRGTGVYRRHSRGCYDRNLSCRVCFRLRRTLGFPHPAAPMTTWK